MNKKKRLYNMHIFVIFLLINFAFATALGQESTTLHEEGSCKASQITVEHARDCLKYTFGKTLQCIGSMYEERRIDNKTAELLTQQALDKLPSGNSYYSIGVQIGEDNKLVLGKQKHYAFDWDFSIPTRIYNIMSETTLVTAFKSKRPILLYTNTFDADVQEMPDWSTSITVPRIGGGMYPLYRHPDAKGGKLVLDCNAYEQWTMRRRIQDVGVAIIMPNNIWCPSSASAYFDVVVANIDMVKEQHGKRTYYLEWFKSEDNSGGEVPNWATEVFQ